MPDAEAMAERARIVAWMNAESASHRKWRDFFKEKRDANPSDTRAAQMVQQYGYYANAYEGAAEEIEAGDHDYIAIPRLSGDQGAK